MSRRGDEQHGVHADPDLLNYWKTLPAPSNERLAVEIIETLQREVAEAKAIAERQMNDAESARLELAEAKVLLANQAQAVIAMNTAPPAKVEPTVPGGVLCRWCGADVPPEGRLSATVAMRDAVIALLNAIEMEQHNEDIFKGKWKKGSKAWSGAFVEKMRKEAIEKGRAALSAAADGGNDG